MAAKVNEERALVSMKIRWFMDIRRAKQEVNIKYTQTSNI
jgi:hypothetical protein